MIVFCASIEAARAGEHGRGFSVVAESIGKLADSLEEQLKGIHQVAAGIENLSTVSEEMKQEMTKFKL